MIYNCETEQFSSTFQSMNLIQEEYFRQWWNILSRDILSKLINNDDVSFILFLLII